jgi:hypothetical protein
LSVYREKMDKAAALREEAARLEKEAFDSRVLPDRWRVGQKVRMRADTDFAWSAGDIMTITRIRDKGRLAHEYQVFYTTTADGFGSFWTTPDDVEELVEDVGQR